MLSPQVIGGPGRVGSWFMAERWPQAPQPSVVLDHRAVQHENALLRELVTVYQHLTGLTLQDADVSTVARLLAERTAATVAVVSRALEVLAAASADAGGDDVAEYVRAYLASPRLAAVLHSTAQTRRSLRLPDVGDAVPRHRGAHPGRRRRAGLPDDLRPRARRRAAGGRRGHEPAGHRARRDDLRGDPRPGAGRGRGGPAGPGRSRRGAAARRARPRRRGTVGPAPGL